MRYTLNLSLLLILVAFVFFSCASKTQIIREQSASIKPAWINIPPVQDDEFYFVGLASYGDSLEEARNDAIQDAIAKISAYLGTSVSSSFESFSSESEHRASLKLKTDSAALVFGATLLETYYEKISRVDSKLKLEKFDVYVLMSISREKVELEIERQKKAKAAKLESAKNLYKRAQSYKSKADYEAALSYYKDALRAMDEAAKIMITKEGEGLAEDELLSDIRQGIAEAASLLLSASVSIQSLIMSKEAKKAFLDHFSSSFSSKGFLISKDKAYFSIVVRLSSRRGGYLMNNYAGYASGSLSVQRLRDKKVIVKLAFSDIKAFHKEASQAIVSAMAEAGDEMGLKTADSILKQLRL